MARKRVWVSWLPGIADGGQIQGLTNTLGKSGLTMDGTLWSRDLAQVGWWQTAGRLLDGEPVDLWLIVGNAVDFEDQSVRYGLSLTCAVVQSQRLPVVTVVAGLDFTPEPHLLTALLRCAHCLPPPWTTWGAKLVALALRRPPPAAGDFRLSVIANPSVGQWFEVGPQEGSRWEGAIFGIDSGEITHQGVGPRGQLPQRCVLEYPSQGLRVVASGHHFTCWSVRNPLDAEQSQYVRVLGSPARILFGALPEQDQAELWVIDLM